MTITGRAACGWGPGPQPCTHLPALLIVGQVAMAWEASCGELLAWVGVLRALWEEKQGLEPQTGVGGL